MQGGHENTGGKWSPNEIFALKKNVAEEARLNGIIGSLSKNLQCVNAGIKHEIHVAKRSLRTIRTCTGHSSLGIPPTPERIHSALTFSSDRPQADSTKLRTRSEYVERDRSVAFSDSISRAASVGDTRGKSSNEVQGQRRKAWERRAATVDSSPHITRNRVLQGRKNIAGYRRAKSSIVSSTGIEKKVRLISEDPPTILTPHDSNEQTDSTIAAKVLKKSDDSDEVFLRPNEQLPFPFNAALSFIRSGSTLPQIKDCIRPPCKPNCTTCRARRRKVSCFCPNSADDADSDGVRFFGGGKENVQSAVSMKDIHVKGKGVMDNKLFSQSSIHPCSSSSNVIADNKSIPQNHLYANRMELDRRNSQAYLNVDVRRGSVFVPSASMDTRRNSQIPTSAQVNRNPNCRRGSMAPTSLIVSGHSVDSCNDPHVERRGSEMHGGHAEVSQSEMLKMSPVEEEREDLSPRPCKKYSRARLEQLAIPKDGYKKQLQFSKTFIRKEIDKLLYQKKVDSQSGIYSEEKERIMKIESRVRMFLAVLNYQYDASKPKRMVDIPLRDDIMQVDITHLLQV